MARSRVVIQGIPAFGRHGANPGERLEPQEFTVDLDVVIDVGRDSLDGTIDYRHLVELASGTVSSTSFVLLESVAQAVAEAIYELSPVITARVTVAKPSAARDMGVDRVSAEATMEG